MSFSFAESEDPPSVNPSSVDDNMEDSDTEKESDGKPATKASSSVAGMDEYEFKDEDEEENLSKALNDRHIPRRELRQRDKEDKDRNHVAGKQSSKGGDSKSKKQKSSRVHLSSDTSSDEMESLSEKRNSPTCSQSSESHKMDTRLKKDNSEQKDKGKVKRKSKSQNKNKENEEDGKENSKTLILSHPTVSESNEKGREEDSFKMSFSPKDDSSVHLFHLSSIKSPKLNNSLADKQCPLKQENTKVSISEGSYNHCSDAEYCSESSSTKGCKHREKSKHQQKDSSVDGDDGRSSPCKDGVSGNSVDSGEAALRKTDLDGKVVKKHKLKHKEKDKHRREYEAERSRHRQKEARKDGHRNLEFDREFWKENFFKSDEADELLAGRKDGEDVGSLQKTADSSPVKDERNSKEKHCGGKEKRPREEREKDKSVKKERKEERAKDSKPCERDVKEDCQGSGRSPEESLQNSVKEEAEEKPVTADQEQLELSEKAPRDKPDRRLPGKEKDSDKMERRQPDKEKKIKVEHSDKAEPQNSVDRWKEKDRAGAASSLSPADKNHRENEKLKSLSAAKRHEDGRKNKDKLEKRSDRERQDREYGAGDHKERDRANSDRRGKPLEKSMEHSKADRLKEKDCDRKKKEKTKDGSLSSGSNLKLLLEDKRSYLSESSKALVAKSKEEAVKMPEKDRDRRDRERDNDRHKDKDRHKDRSQQVRINKAKPGEGDADKSKPKTPTAPRDAKPKEKRLVNDDLMQTSFERMLSLKDQEIELWHRKHLEKIKQKERERLRQRPPCDPGKSKPKDRKPELCPSKELTRSKSSEASDVHGREKPLKDGTGNRTLSLDGKSAPSIGAKVMSVVENCLSRSPRPESDRAGLMSRSVSLVSVASSEESYQATTLTPRHTEYDSDVNLETSDSQQAFLQSSLVIQAARSPSVHDRDCNSLPDVPQSNQTPRHLQSVLEEDSSPSAEAEGAEHPCKHGLNNTAGEEPAKETSEPDENLSSQLSLNPSGLPVRENEGDAAGPSETQDLPNQTLPQPDACQMEQESPLSPDPAAAKDVSSQGECRSYESDQPLTSSEPPTLTDATTFHQRETLPYYGTENRTDALLLSDHRCDEAAENPAPENMDTSSENPTLEVAESQPPTTSVHIPTSAPGDFPEAQEDTDDAEKSQPSVDDEVARPDVQMEDAGSSVTSELKEEETSDAQQSSESSAAATPEGCSLKGGVDGPSEPKEIPAEPMEVAPADDLTESSATDQSPSSIQSAPQTDSSNASGSSSPQSGDRDSDSSGAKLKGRHADEDADAHVPHPRKRKMPKLSNSQLCSATQQEKEKCQQSLAAMVDSVKLEEIEPYQTERANPYYEFLHIRKKIEEKRKVLCNVTPQPPQYYDEYVTFNGSYLLDGNPLSKLCIPTVSSLYTHVLSAYE